MILNVLTSFDSRRSKISKALELGALPDDVVSSAATSAVRLSSHAFGKEKHHTHQCYSMVICVSVWAKPFWLLPFTIHMTLSTHFCADVAVLGWAYSAVEPQNEVQG